MRDDSDPSHASGLLYKGIPSNHVRDEGLWRAVFSLVVSSIPVCSENTARLPVAGRQP